MKAETGVEIVWCPGCGNFNILKAFKKAIESIGIDRKKLVVVTGVGCHGKLANYVNLSSFHTIHGRVPPLMAGIRLANPELVVVGFAGDGDAYNEGLVHTVHIAKKNYNATLIVHNNSVYGLTTGQASATSPREMKTKSTPRGNPEEPLNPVALMLTSGASFVARGFAGDVEQLSEIIAQAIMHRGFSFIDVLQPCATFNNTWSFYKERVYRIEKEPTTLEEALRLAYQQERIPTGIFFRQERETFEEQVLPTNQQ